MPQDPNTPGQAPVVTQTPGDAPAVTTEPTAVVEEPTPTDPPVEPQAPAQDPIVDADESGLWTGVDETHPLRKTVADLRSESAARRTENRRLQEANDELKAKLSSATTPEAHQQAIAEYDEKLKTAQLDTARERAGRKFGLPDALVSRLAGDTEEALETDAQALQALLGTPAPTPPTAPQGPPRGGLNPNEDRVDPAAQAKAIRQRNAGGITRM